MRDHQVPKHIIVVAATSLEARAARKALPQSISVIEAGISLLQARVFDAPAISCGLAGGLREDLPTGTLLVPRKVRKPDGATIECDPALVELLLRACAQLGHAAVDAPLVTSTMLVHGDRRRELAAEGFAGVDMETGLIHAPTVACVRVVLDTPQREIHPAWINPPVVLFHPRAWRDLPFLAREGPRCAALAAAVLATALTQ